MKENTHTHNEESDKTNGRFLFFMWRFLREFFRLLPLLPLLPLLG
nr:MAG TPA: hypothetical protein [Caudoviricetes sp.]